MQDDTPSYLAPLNSQQQSAVLHTGPPLLILAGAGSGKTRVITTKIAWLIREKGINPHSILAVTFTNKAAKEMAERARQIDESASSVMLRTFHSFGAWFLRRYGKAAGLDSSFLIYDDSDMKSLLSTIMKEAKKSDVKLMAHNISRAKDYCLSPGDSSLRVIDGSHKFSEVYLLYEERLKQTGNVDFGDLIKLPVEILRKEPDILSRIRDRFSVIMVDEYQDANVAQFELLKLLAGENTYVCVVGDDDQSIYRFRGAEVKNILDFPEKFSGTEIIRLEDNYRSTESILKAASSVVAHNKGRLGKTLNAKRGEGILPVLTYLPNQDEEAVYCASLIENSVRAKKSKFSDWAILYRTNAQSRGFETKFIERGIPYKIVGTVRFYEREEIKDALALLSFLANPNDEVAFRRIVNKPTRGLGALTVDQLIEHRDGANLFETIKKRALTMKTKAKIGAETFIKIIEDAKTLLENPLTVNVKAGIKSDSMKAGKGLSLCVMQMVENSGLPEYHFALDDVMGMQRQSNMQELVNAASDYPCTFAGLLDFLEVLQLDKTIEDDDLQSSGPQNSGGRVTLITFHNTKGLEFKNVIMTGLEQGVFPREEKNKDDIEEERRLFYVGATRAMDELYLCCCHLRRMFGRTMQTGKSLFLKEIDEKCLQIFGSPPRDFSEDSCERNSEWKRGQYIFHDNYGYGSVFDIQDTDDGPLVKVIFESGKKLNFLSEHQSHSFVKINYDY